MICKRCGRCCIHLDILVVNPRSILPDGSLDRSDPEAMILKPAGQICPHLVEAKAEGDIATCTIHSLPCYKETPCERFEQIGPQDSICLLHSYLSEQRREDRKRGGGEVRRWRSEEVEKRGGGEARRWRSEEVEKRGGGEARRWRSEEVEK